MRQILVDYAPRHRAGKRGAGNLTLTLDEAIVLSKQRELRLVALDNALNVLAALYKRQSHIVELRFSADSQLTRHRRCWAFRQPQLRGSGLRLERGFIARWIARQKPLPCGDTAKDMRTLRHNIE
jgi:hypothetical protein